MTGRGGTALRRPADVRHFVVAEPYGGRATLTGCRGRARIMRGGRHGGHRSRIVLVDEVPQKYEAIVRTRGQNPAAIGRPLNAVDGGAVALQFKKSLSGLSDV